MATATAALLSAEEFALLPKPGDGSRQELVKGSTTTMTPPGVEHGEIQTNVAYLLKQYVLTAGKGRVAVESGIIIERGPDTVRGPDAMYWSADRLPAGVRIEGFTDVAPDLCVEILSPSNRKAQIRAKTEEYFGLGVRMVWVVDPEDRHVTVYRSADEGRVLHERAALDGEDVLPGFRCRVADLFA